MKIQKAYVQRHCCLCTYALYNGDHKNPFARKPMLHSPCVGWKQ